MNEKEHIIQVHDFMIADLGISGAEILLYALIYQYASVRPFKLECSLKYLADRIKKDEKYTRKLVDRLIEKNLIERQEVDKKGIITIIYKVIREKTIPFLEKNFPNGEKFSARKRKEAKEKDTHTSIFGDTSFKIKDNKDIDSNSPKLSNTTLQSISNKNLDSNTPKNDKSKFQSLDNKNLDSDSLKSDNKDTTTTDTKNKRNIFIPPTVEEVRQYCQEKGYGVNPEDFVNFYESKNWYVGKNKMVKWKASVALWESKIKKEIADSNTDEEDDYPHDLDYIF